MFSYRLRFLLYPFCVGLIWLSLFRIFFYFYHGGFFQDIGGGEVLLAMLYGLRFDLATLSFIYGPLGLALFLPGAILRHKAFAWVYSFVLFLAFLFLVILSFADLQFFPEVGRHISFEITLLNKAQSSLLLTLVIAYFWTLIFALVSLIVLTYLWYKGFFRLVRAPALLQQLADAPSFFSLRWQSQAWLVGKNLLSGCLFLLLVIFIGRGGWQIKPISARDAFFSTNLKTGQIVLQAPFSVLKTLDESTTLEKFAWVDQKTADQLSIKLLATKERQTFPEPERYPLYRERVANGPAKPYNVVIMAIESFAKFALDATTPDNQLLMPFTQALTKKSLYFDRFFSNGTRSVEGISSIFACINTIPHESFIYSPYQQNKVFQTGLEFKKLGFSSAFFHFSFYGSYNIHQFVKSLGFERVFSKEDIPNADQESDEAWGLTDNYAFKHISEELGKQKEPFIAGFFSLSTHDPFVIRYPEANIYPDLKGLNGYYNSFRQFDMDLEAFFAEASKQPWYNNTIFIITGDHGKGKNTFLEHNLIPLIVFSPNPQAIKPGKISLVGQQTDILPTIFDLLNLNLAHPCSGKSLISGTAPNFAYVNDGLQFWVEDQWVYQFDKDQLIAVFSFTSDPKLEKPLTDYPKAPIENYKAWMQTHNALLIDNRFVP